jgi:hypothetical protein
MKERPFFDAHASKLGFSEEDAPLSPAEIARLLEEANAELIQRNINAELSEPKSYAGLWIALGGLAGLAFGWAIGETSTVPGASFLIATAGVLAGVLAGTAGLRMSQRREPPPSHHASESYWLVHDSAAEQLLDD